MAAKGSESKRRWLIKSDPDDYSAHDLERDGQTLWTGVRNAQAQIHLRAMSDGDDLLVYHTGDEKSVVARARVCGRPSPDASDNTGKRHAVRIEFTSRLRSPVSLAALRSDRRFETFDLIRNSRLSVMSVREEHWKLILALAEAAGE